jgi:small subunit ribosomal protein S15
MALTKDSKADIVKKYGKSGQDTGMPEVQIALLTARINQLTEHLKAHKHDESSRRGLLMLVGQRRRHLVYLSRMNPNAYNAITERLSLRRK